MNQEKNAGLKYNSVLLRLLLRLLRFCYGSVTVLNPLWLRFTALLRFFYNLRTQKKKFFKKKHINYSIYNIIFNRNNRNEVDNQQVNRNNNRNRTITDC